MSNQDHPQGDSQDAKFPEIDELLRSANPNPQRIGCPPGDRLIELARRRGAINDPFYQHLLGCSECYAEWQELRDAEAVEERDRDDHVVVVPGWRRLWWLAAAAGVVLMLLSALWVLRQSPTVGPPSGTQVRGAETVSIEARAELDLRRFRVERRELTEASKPSPLALGRGLVEVTIILPDLSEAGRYDVKVMDRELRTYASATADAGIRDGRTQLTVTLDLRSAAAGACQLAIRRHGDEWRFYPATIAS
jgi:hypothetical protein